MTVEEIHFALIAITLLSGGAGFALALRSARGDTKRLEVALKFASISAAGVAALCALVLRGT